MYVIFRIFSRLYFAAVRQRLVWGAEAALFETTRLLEQKHMNSMFHVFTELRIYSYQIFRMLYCFWISSVWDQSIKSFSSCMTLDCTVIGLFGFQWVHLLWLLLLNIKFCPNGTLIFQVYSLCAWLSSLCSLMCGRTRAASHLVNSEHWKFQLESDCACDDLVCSHSPTEWVLI